MASLACRLRAGLIYAAAGVVVAAASIAVALAVTPMQQVSVLGQEIGVGAAAPSFNVSGPGEVDLFGQRLPTRVQFAGPVRPRLALTLPSHPRVLVNLYYDPFDTQRTCLDGKGLDAAKEKSLIGLLGALNRVLAKGAQAASQTSVQPDFTGHALCDLGPYVQGAKDPAPFHPTAAGQLAIALADEQALRQAESSPGASPATLVPTARPATIRSGTMPATP